MIIFLELIRILQYMVCLCQLAGFFKGMSYPILANGAINSIFFGVYGVTLRSIAEKRQHQTGAKPTHFDVYLAGIVAGAAQMVLACPVDVVKVKLQTQTGISDILYNIAYTYINPQNFAIAAII